VQAYVIPLLVVAALTSGYASRGLFTRPTTQARLPGQGNATVTCVVEGLKCKGTANFFTGLYRDRAGIAAIETIASEHVAVFRYDGATITPAEIRAIMEAPVPLADGRRVQVFRCVEMKEGEEPR
jgi:hypothetical protein